MKVFTPTRKIIILISSLFLLMLAATGYLVYSCVLVIPLVFNLQGDLSPSILEFIALGLILLLLLAVGLITIWLGIYLNALRKTRLTLDDRAMTFEFTSHLPSYRNRGLKPFSIIYDQVQNIKLAEGGTALEIYDFQNNKFLLAPIMFGENYGENVLAELRNRFPSQKIQIGADVAATQKLLQKKQMKAAVPYLIVMAVYFITMVLDPRMSSRPWMTVWDIEFNPRWSESIWRYTPDAQNGFWVIGWHSNYYRIYPFPKQNNLEWKLPDSVLRGEYPDAASLDASGNPIVMAGGNILRHTSGTWQTTPLQTGLGYIDWGKTAIDGGQAWAVVDKMFVNINLLTGTWEPISLPESARLQGLFPFSMRRSTQGKVLVMTNQGVQQRVYIYHDGKWSSQEYTIVLPEEHLVWDYFLDENGFLWILFATQKQTLVERVDLSDGFHWTVLPSFTDRGDLGFYKKIFIDKHERMWVTSSSYPRFISVLQPVWEDNAIQLVRYTTGNSNYNEGVSNPPTMLANGQIWGFDDVITTMDTNQSELPAPLPDWFGNLDWNMIKLYLIPCQLLALIYMLIMTTKLTKELKQRIPGSS